jgi:hypothetical protein
MKPLLCFLLISCSLAAQDSPSRPQPSQRIEITLERQEGELWKAVDPGFVFEKGDCIRFRFRSNFDGFLYVMDMGTSGDYSQLFPREETGRENKITSGKEYQIPATQAYKFRISGPPGHDIVYWMMSPLALASGNGGFVPPAMPKTKQPPKTLIPRCDDTIFRARGECIDSSAGLRGISDTNELPDNLKNVPRMDPRELVIMRKEESSLISSPVPLTGPVLYQFRLAHK